MSDGTLAAALPMMLRLQEVVFDHCQNITVASLWHLLEQPNDLTSIQVWQCIQINQNDKDDMKRTIKEENLDVYFEWYPYIEEEEALLEAGYLNLESDGTRGLLADSRRYLKNGLNRRNALFAQ